MLLIIADYPNEFNLREGTMQRVDAIDSLILNRDRVYLNLSFKKNIKRNKKVVKNCTIENLNIITHQKIIKSYLERATSIYVHSVYNLFKIIKWVDLNKTILDIHGVVPEELYSDNKKMLSALYNHIERKAILECKCLVHVTNAMVKHYETKYGLSLTQRSIVLPIFEYKEITQSTEKWSTETIKAIYLGGMQSWQNLEKMLALSSNARNNNSQCSYQFDFFVPQRDIEIFKQKYATDIKLSSANVSTLTREEVIPFLKQCHLGFVLRDDIVVNRVACPTKLVEYLECGVVPIVLSPYIGDFFELGYKYITMESFESNKIDLAEVQEMAKHNLHVLAEYQSRTMKAKNLLVNELS
ncbi:glycosyltransferase family 4 protein [Citrobacter freundii]|uniref:glycosyltransferase family 4 protein n=2 Tax=Citrobacter freundii TaxID=546 RepID=UPI001398519B|nr:glycosyltransferase family 4 protein [Citrobacter freundii]MDV1318296.1 glycosyl transferase family 2 [Citrobacter freundii]MEB0347050.1 glycosyl transferase family 2 [Citrobacter freundii]MEC5781784.1 glycosyl transferase family 2 [Citrobacter freundii]QHX04524.1 glycosyltransferase family 4 protein [Citrobacter freundii]